MHRKSLAPIYKAKPSRHFVFKDDTITGTVLSIVCAESSSQSSRDRFGLTFRTTLKLYKSSAAVLRPISSIIRTQAMPFSPWFICSKMAQAVAGAHRSIEGVFSAVIPASRIRECRVRIFGLSSVSIVHLHHSVLISRRSDGKHSSSTSARLKRRIQALILFASTSSTPSESGEGVVALPTSSPICLPHLRLANSWEAT